MVLHSNGDIRHNIFSAIKKKIGNINIQLELTQNGRARLTIASHRIVKDFVNQRDALQWLIHTYNLKHLKTVLDTTHAREVVKTREATKRHVIDDAAREIYEEIEELDYYSTETFKSIVKEFDLLKLSSGFSDDEIGYVYNMVLELLQKLLDKTLNHKRYEVYKKYFEQLKTKGYRQS